MFISVHSTRLPWHLWRKQAHHYKDMASSPAPIVSEQSYSTCVDPQRVALLDLLEMNVSYERCSGLELTTANGRCILDFLSGYCVHNTGHNHPYMRSVFNAEAAAIDVRRSTT